MEGWMLNREKGVNEGHEVSSVQGVCLLLKTAVTGHLTSISAWTTVTFRWRPYGPCITGQLLPIFIWTCLWPPSQKWYKSSMIYLNVNDTGHHAVVLSSLNISFFLKDEKAQSISTQITVIIVSVFRTLFTHSFTQLIKPWHV